MLDCTTNRIIPGSRMQVHADHRSEQQPNKSTLPTANATPPGRNSPATVRHASEVARGNTHLESAGKNKLDASLIDTSGWNIRHGASMVRLPVWENDG